MSCIQTQVSLGLLPRPKKHKLCCFSKPGNHRPKWAIASIASCEIAVIRATFASDSLGDVPMKPSLWVICWQCFHAYPSLPALYYYHFRWWVHRYTQHGPINPSAPYSAWTPLNSHVAYTFTSGSMDEGELPHCPGFQQPAAPGDFAALGLLGSSKFRAANVCHRNNGRIFVEVY